MNRQAELHPSEEHGGGRARLFDHDARQKEDIHCHSNVIISGLGNAKISGLGKIG
jgi:hypothetical protein